MSKSQKKHDRQNDKRFHIRLENLENQVEFQISKLHKGDARNMSPTSPRGCGVNELISAGRKTSNWSGGRDNGAV